MKGGYPGSLVIEDQEVSFTFHGNWQIKKKK